MIPRIRSGVSCLIVTFPAFRGVFRGKELGGEYSNAQSDWAEYAVQDGRLITGQNPSSSKAVAQLVMKSWGRYSRGTMCAWRSWQSAKAQLTCVLRVKISHNFGHFVPRHSQSSLTCLVIVGSNRWNAAVTIPRRRQSILPLTCNWTLCADTAVHQSSGL
jgi:hypothetical protein